MRLFPLLLCLWLSLSALAQSTPELLMPQPQSARWTQEQFSIPPQFTITLQGPGTLTTAPLGHYTERFIRRLGSYTGHLQMPERATQGTGPAHLTIRIGQEAFPVLGVDESYQLTVRAEGVQLQAATDLGAMRGLETLLQLADYGPEGPYFHGVQIEDAPRFAWRGLLLDASRHFMPVHVLKRTLDGMAAVKMNVLHWHLCDDHGWRVELNNSPRLHQLASAGQYYTQAEIREIVAYAAARGIRVVPEVDVPGHASAILTAYPELGSKDTTYHLQRYAGVFDPTLDPTNPATYSRLQAVFEEMATLFPDAYFHIGGDENEGKHWAANAEIQAYMEEHNLEDQGALQAHFNVRLQKILAPLGKKLMGWDEILDGDLPTTAIIQAWRGWIAQPDQLPHARAARKGHQVVVSMGYYLDLLYPAADHYLADPMPVAGALNDAQAENILGGEACMWAELITPATVDSRLWPRTAAMAERLWSPADTRDVASMYRRLAVVSKHLELLGLQHRTFAAQYVRRMATTPQQEEMLHTLLDVCEPLKGYTRNTNGNLYSVYSPYTLFADACTADAPQARRFRAAINEYLEGTNQEAAAREIMALCDHWLALPRDSEALFAHMPEGEALKTHLEGLQLLAKLTLLLIGQDRPQPEVLTDAASALNQYKAQQARTELMIVPGVAKLLEHYQGEKQ